MPHSDCEGFVENLSPVFVSRRRGKLACDVRAIPDWDGLEKIAAFLERYFSATVVQRFDGPDARRWILTINGSTIELQHEDPWGNVIIAPEPRAEPLVLHLAEELRRRLENLSGHYVAHVE